jgi:GT2 family glycosyltransferase
MKNLPKVLCFTINFNGKEDTAELIKSIKKQNYPNYDILIVDNSRTDEDVKDLKKRFSWLKIIRNKTNMGCSIANNQAIKYALKNGFDYIWVLNNDLIVDKECLNEMVKIITSDNSIAVVGGKAYVYGSKNYLQTIARSFNPKKASLSCVMGEDYDKGQFDEIRDVEYLWGGSILMDLIKLEKVGFYDEAFFCYYEAFDLQLKLREKDYKILYSPKAKIWHKGGKSKPNSRIFHYYDTRNRFLIGKRYSRGFDKFCFYLYFPLIVVLIHSVRLIFKLDLKGAYSVIEGAFDGLRRKYGFRKFK